MKQAVRSISSQSNRPARQPFTGCSGHQASPSRLPCARPKQPYPWKQIPRNNLMSLLDALLLYPYRINVWIAYRTDGVAGSGTQNDPWDGSTATRLDTVLNSLLANTRVHFGPGTFQINGYQDGATSGWLKSGMKIVGSGIDVTKLQMVGATTASKHYFAIGHPFSSGGQPNLMDYFEISD